MISISENNLVKKTLRDSCPVRNCQTVGLFNIRVSYKGNFFQMGLLPNDCDYTTVTTSVWQAVEAFSKACRARIIALSVSCSKSMGALAFFL